MFHELKMIKNVFKHNSCFIITEKKNNNKVYNVKRLHWLIYIQSTKCLDLELLKP